LTNFIKVYIYIYAVIPVSASTSASGSHQADQQPSTPAPSESSLSDTISILGEDLPPAAATSSLQIPLGDHAAGSRVTSDQSSLPASPTYGQLNTSYFVRCIVRAGRFEVFLPFL